MTDRLDRQGKSVKHPPPIRRHVRSAGGARAGVAWLPVDEWAVGSSRPENDVTTPSLSAPPRSRIVRKSWAMAEPYRLLRRLAPGKLVFEALNRRTNRRVTIQLTGAITDLAELGRRYGAVARLSQANSVQIRDIGIVEGQPRVGFIVRDYVVGRDLGRHLEQHGALPMGLSLSLALQVLRSLAAAHSVGMIHGRLAPEHVLVSNCAVGGQHVSVVGYSRALHSRVGDLGHYAAPELEHFGQEHPQSDLYSLALILCHCLFGKPEWNQDVREQSGMPKALVQILDRALAHDPRDRFVSAKEMSEALCRLDWSQHEQTRLNADRYLLGVMPTRSRSELPVEHNQCMATRPVSIWVLDDDPSLHAPNVVDALETLGALYDLRRIKPVERSAAKRALEEGAVSPPWLVLYGGLTVVLKEPLLETLAGSAEVGQVLIAREDNLRALVGSVGYTGLDMHVGSNNDAEAIVHSIQKAIGRTRGISGHYDSLRVALRDVRDQVSDASIELTQAR